MAGRMARPSGHDGRRCFSVSRRKIAVLIFKSLSREQFDKLSVDQRMEYLHRLMTDLRQKLADTRKQQEAMHKDLPKN